MAEWNTVRNDPSYPEKLDPEIIPLCDVLNASGFETTQSCCGHGSDWPRVWFKHSTDERIEAMARWVMESEREDFGPRATLFQKEILLDGYQWLLEIHLNNVYASTPPYEALNQAVRALKEVSNAINEWYSKEGTIGTV